MKKERTRNYKESRVLYSLCTDIELQSFQGLV